MNKLEAELALTIRLLPVILFLSSQEFLLLKLDLSYLSLKLKDFLLNLVILPPHIICLLLYNILVYVLVLA